MTNFAENFEKLSEMQKKSFEPARNLAEFAVGAFETLARQNYAFAGDVLEFAVAQAKLPVDVADPRELFERQVSATRQFAELVNERAIEYVELSKSFNDTSASLFEQELGEAAKPARKAAAKKAA